MQNDILSCFKKNIILLNETEACAEYSKKYLNWKFKLAKTTKRWKSWLRKKTVLQSLTVDSS